MAVPVVVVILIGIDRGFVAPGQVLEDRGISNCQSMRHYLACDLARAPHITKAFVQLGVLQM